MPDDRRNRDRHEILGELPGEVTIVQPMSVLEISAGGALVEVTVPLVIDSLHEFRLLLGEHAVVIKGRVVHCQVGDVEHEQVLYRAGIEFVEPPAHAAEAVRHYIEALRVARPGR